MEILRDFIVHNFVLLCLSFVMIFNAIYHFSINKRISLYSIAITACCFVLAICVFTTERFKDSGLLYPALTTSILGYVLRPICLFFFIMMNKNTYRGKWAFLIWIPLALNLFVYLAAYIPGTQNVIFGYGVNADGSLSFLGGPLRYSSHIISACYLAYLIYLSVFTLRAKYIMHGITILVCAFFVTAAVVVETFFNTNGDVDLLNATIMVSTLTYYLFLYRESKQVDILTGLFNREACYRDLEKMSRSITGIIQFDINGLKYLNDNYGHEEGDKCIITVGNAIQKSLNKSMYAYRMGGDEFITIVNDSNEAEILKTLYSFKEIIEKTDYHCSVGYAYRGNEQISIDDLIKEAEKKMYLDKNEFYKNANFERRKI